MMSSEEDTECFGLYGDKLLKKAKRTRQRVDAGEPRNSYSSIPNFSSRPSFISGGLYGAIFQQQHSPNHQQQQHFSGLFTNQQVNSVCNNFAPSKMLNELLGRQMKAADAASSAELNMMGSAMDTNNSSSGGNNNDKQLINGNFDSNNAADQIDNAHMLRDILQGRKKELLALEQELRVGSNDTSNNNNNEIKSEQQDVTSTPNSPHQQQQQQQSSGQQQQEIQEVDSEREEPEEDDDDCNNSDASESVQQQTSSGKQQQQQQNAKQSEIIMENENSDSFHSDLSRASNNSLVNIKEEDMMLDEDINSPTQQNKEQKSNENNEIKRARVENIVSTMRSSPSLPVQVNGCKKRKLYHPQQHDSARYGGMVLDVLDDDDDAPALKQKRVEKDALKSQLRTMQEQLAEMQQKYVQLCNRMELESDCQDENTGDMSMELSSASAIAAAAAAAAAEELLEKSSQAVTTNPAAVAAAAMYLGVGHKMFLEQEAQRLKEAVGGEHPHHPQLPPHAQHHHHPGGQAPPSAGPMPQGPHHHPCPPPHHHHHPSSHQLAVAAAAAAKNAEFSERFPFFRNAPVTDLEGLAEILKTEISASLTILIDSILSRFIQQRRFLGKQSDAAAEQLNKDLLLASQLLDRKSPRTKVIDRGPNNNSNNNPNSTSGGGGINPNNPGTSNSGNGLGCGSTAARVNGTAFPINLANSSTTNNSNSIENSSSSINLPPHLRPPISMASTSMFQPPKPPTMSNNHQQQQQQQPAVSTSIPVINGGASAVGGPASSALYSMGSLAGSNPFCHTNHQQHSENQTPQQSPQHRHEPRDRELPEQNEALSLVVTTKKKRHKVTDTRITPRTVSRILSQETSAPPPPGTPNSSGGATPGPGGVGCIMDPKYGSLVPSTSVNTSVNNTEPRGMMSSGSSVGNDCTSPRPYHPPPPPMLPVSLPTSVAIPNPGLHESQVFSPYSPFYGQHQSSSPPDRRDAESPLSHPPTLLHPALLAAHGTPDYGHMRSGPNNGGGAASDTTDRGLDSSESPFDGMQPALSFSNSRWFPFSAAGRLTSPVRDSGKKSIRDYLSLLKQESLGNLNEPYSSTLTPMHLRKAKLMFFWVRYPSSAVLKMYFPDIKFNKNNTAQLVKWFSNFREFYYIQMEKYARQSITEGLKNADDIHVTGDSEIYRVLNLHYNRNNHIEVWGPQVPSNFRYVVESTLREFFKAIQTGKDTEQSWKKSIYKVISRLDDPVPEYFKSPNFLEQLE